MLKTTGILLLVLGVAVAAAAGIRLGATEYRGAVSEGQAALTGTTAMAVVPTPAGKRVVEWLDAAGVQFLAGLALLIAGAVIGRVAIGRDGAAAAAANGHDFEDSLDELARGIEATLAALDQVTPGESQIMIEALSEEQVRPMVEARTSLQRRYGLAGAVAVMGPLSGAERLLNRAWSALVDGFPAESRASLVGATAEVVAARQALLNLSANRTGTQGGAA